MYFWLRRACVAARRFSLVASRVVGLLSGVMMGPSTASAVGARGLSCPAACGIFPQGLSAALARRFLTN